MVYMMPTLYRRYVDDTMARMSSTDAAVDFLSTLNNSLHSSLSFAIEFPVDNKIPFIEMEIIKTELRLKHKCIERRQTLACCCISMIDRAYALSSTTEAFNEECTELRFIFIRLDYPITMINSTINKFIHNISSSG